LATVFFPLCLCSPCVTPRRAESKRCGAEAHGLGRSRSDFNPTRRIARERAAGGNHVTAYEGRDIAGCWSSEGDDWALIILPTSKMVSEGPCDGTKPCSGWAQHTRTRTVLVPGQLVSQTPNGAMHHRASEARSLYVMMHGKERKRKAGSRRGSSVSPGSLEKRLLEIWLRERPANATKCCAVPCYTWTVYCLFQGWARGLSILRSRNWYLYSLSCCKDTSTSKVRRVCTFELPSFHILRLLSLLAELAQHLC